MKKILLLLLLFMYVNLYARTQNDMRALSIYQFTKLIEWPSNSKTGMFRIGVLGSFADYKELSDVTLGRNVGSQNIEVMNVMSLNQLNLTDFHILLIGDSFCSAEYIKEISAQLKGKSTLIIANKLNYSGNDVCIGFVGEGQSMKYYYTFPAIQAKGLKCSQNFLQLGRRID